MSASTARPGPVCLATESAAVGNAPEAEIAALRDYGYKVGMAFQTMDDILTLAMATPDRLRRWVRLRARVP